MKRNEDTCHLSDELQEHLREVKEGRLKRSRLYDPFHMKDPEWTNP